MRKVVVAIAMYVIEWATHRRAQRVEQTISTFSFVMDAINNNSLLLLLVQHGKLLDQ